MAEHENISSYIDVSNVLSVDLALENGHYIDPSISAYARQQQQTQQQQAQQRVQAREKENNEYHDDNDNDDDDNDNNANDDNDNNAKTSDSIRLDVPGVPPLPPGANPKKICPFCERTFSHPGSLGRHLDLKKGTSKHPADVIAQMRAEVKRRGNRELVLNRRRERAREYNRRDDVRVRSNVARRMRDRVSRARKTAMSKFVERLGRPDLQPHPTFARLVVYFLPPEKWPHDPPTLETHRMLCDHLNEMFFPENGQYEEESSYHGIMTKVIPASENWLGLDDRVKQEIWTRELRRAAEEALKNTSLYQLKNRDDWMAKEAVRAVENNEDLNDLQELRERLEDKVQEEKASTQQDPQLGKQQLPKSQQLPPRHHHPPSSAVPLPQNHGQQTSRQLRNIMIRSKPPVRPAAGTDGHEESVFNHEELAAVAAAASQVDKNDGHLDPQLMSR